MAVYEYKCKNCGYEFERILKIDDRLIPESEPCEKCGGVVCKVILTPIAFGDSVRLGVTKVPTGFNEVLKGVKNANRNSTINVHGN